MTDGDPMEHQRFCTLSLILLACIPVLGFISLERVFLYSEPWHTIQVAAEVVWILIASYSACVLWEMLSE
jgi:hypothetical protein